MGQLRIKLEGEAQDIQKLFHKGAYPISGNVGTVKKWKRISNLWIWGSSLIFFVLSCCIYADVLDNTWYKVAILGVFLLGFLITGMVQYNFRIRILTIIAAVAGLVTILIALKVYSPQEVARKIERVTTKKVDGK